MKRPEPKQLYHVVGGRPWLDPDCPICRAHGITPEKFPGRDEPYDGGLLLVEVLALEDMLRCACPLCVQARR